MYNKSTLVNCSQISKPTYVHFCTVFNTLWLDSSDHHHANNNIQGFSSFKKPLFIFPGHKDHNNVQNFYFIKRGYGRKKKEKTDSKENNGGSWQKKIQSILFSTLFSKLKISSVSYLSLENSWYEIWNFDRIKEKMQWHILFHTILEIFFTAQRLLQISVQLYEVYVGNFSTYQHSDLILRNLLDLRERI